MLSSPLAKSPSGPAETKNGRPARDARPRVPGMIGDFAEPSGETTTTVCPDIEGLLDFSPLSRRTRRPPEGTNRIGLFQPSSRMGVAEVFVRVVSCPSTSHP